MTTDMLEEDFAHFGYPCTLIMNSTTTFLLEEFEAWCHERGIIHLTRALYHPAMNGAAELLIHQSSSWWERHHFHPCQLYRNFTCSSDAHNWILAIYPGNCMFNGQQIQCNLDALLPLPAHAAQGKQARKDPKTQQMQHSHLVSNLGHLYAVGVPCHALYCSPKHDKKQGCVHARWSINVHVVPRELTWYLHIDQLCPCYGVEEDAHLGRYTNVTCGMT